MKRPMPSGGLSVRAGTPKPLTDQDYQTAMEMAACGLRLRAAIRYDQALCYFALRNHAFTAEIQEQTGCASLEEFLKEIGFPRGAERAHLLQAVELVDKETFIHLGEERLTALADAINEARKSAGLPQAGIEDLKKDCEPIFAAYVADHTVYDEKSFHRCARAYLSTAY
jgi:hypothetical protein